MTPVIPPALPGMYLLEVMAVLSCRVDYDPALLAAVVTCVLKLGGASGKEAGARYRGEAEALYRHGPDERERAFAVLDARWFCELGVERCVRAALGRHTAVLDRLASLTLALAAGAAGEGADLVRGSGGEPGAVIRIAPTRCLVVDELAAFLDHELTRLADLLDPGFRHVPDDLAEVPPHRRRLVQHRYRLAWAATIDARLARVGLVPLATRGEHRARLGELFPGTAESLDGLVAELMGTDAPTHGQLMAVAQLPAATEPRRPGAPCPICGFPTHAWVDAHDPDVNAAVKRDAPHWEPAQGLCERCCERYLVRRS